LHPDKRYLTSRQLRDRYGGRSHMWISRRLKADPKFPRPKYFGRYQYFDLDEIEAYERTAVGGGEAA
jgi:hypothetical protein